MKTIVHAVTSLLISIIMYFANLPIESCVFCFLVGVFVDVDHFLDFLLWEEDKDLKKFWILGHNYFIEVHSTDYLFHSIDLFSLLIIPFILYWPALGFGMIVGFAGHLILDQIGFHYDSFHFFLLYRIFVEKRKSLELRDAVLKRDGFKCRDCGATQKLQLHRKSRQKSWDTVDEWMTVCEECHMKRHGSGVFY